MTRFVILVLDGLRPDLVTAERMPNLAAFRDGAAVLTGSRAQFPSHTRVNKTSFATGTTPRHHGIHFNRLYDPAVWTDRFIDIGDHADVAAADAATRLITATPAGEAMAEAGKRLAVVHCGMSGAPWLLNYRGERFGQEHLSLAGYPHSTPALAGLVRAAMGEMPDPKGVNLDRSAWALRALTGPIWDGWAPDVAVLWSDEPDKSLHVDGIRGPVSATALAHCDAMVGDLVAWWRARQDVNLLIVSDHGHVEKSAQAPLAAAFAEAGFPVTTEPARPGAVLNIFGCGGLYLRDQPPESLFEIVRWMQAQPWCGSLFTAGTGGAEGHVPGTFSTGLVTIDHPRAPDLIFATLRQDADDAWPFGHATEPGKPGGSTHGGAHPGELRNTFFAAGPDFRQAHVSEMSGGLIDIFPTIFSRLGVEQPLSMTGRPLGDLLAGGTAPADAQPRVDRYEVSAGSYRQSLELRRLARRSVIERGVRE
ncbi:MAG: alkaline phosphatase family protein [Pseudooceanicola sp.]|nr:alkaline phosphatase family protein [Pseudooceanicola sp.]